MPPFNIPFTKLVDLVDGRLPAAERACLLWQIADDTRAAVEVTQIRCVIEFMRTDSTEAVPPHVFARAVGLFQLPKKPPPRRRYVRAVLQFDMKQQSLAHGIRSGQGAARQLLFSAQEYVLDLRITPAGSMWTVMGQVLGPCTGGWVALRGAAAPRRAALNALCEFVLPPIPAGSYTLALSLQNVEVEIPGLEIGP